MRFAILLGLMFACNSFSIPVFQVIPTLGPSSTSPNLGGWASNVIAGLMNGTSPGTGVVQYVPLGGSSVAANEIISTSAAGFPSWKGVSFPSGSYQNEVGTTLYFSVVVKDDGGFATFSLSDLFVTETYLGVTLGTTPIGGDYRSTAVGVLQNGGLLSSGPSTELVKEFYYVGAGFTFEATSFTGTEQEQIEAAVSELLALQSPMAEVCYQFSSNSPTCSPVSIVAQGVPEPSTFLMVSGAIAAGCLRQFRRRRKYSGE